MNHGTLSGILTAILIALFIALCVWAYSPRRRATFDALARMPLDESESARVPPELSRRKSIP